MRYPPAKLIPLKGIVHKENKTVKGVTMEKGKIFAKIQKLLALGAGESAEAKSAMEKAGKLMADNNIGLEDITDGAIKKDSIFEEVVNISAKHITVWEVNLAKALCEAFGCECLKQVTPMFEQRMFLGTKSDLKLLIWYYKYLRIKVAREAETKFRLVRDQKSFGVGAVNTLSHRIMDMFAAKQKVMSNDTKALVVVKTDAVEKYIQKTYNVVRGRKRNLHNLNHDAVQAGQEAGRNMSISRPVTGTRSATGASMIGR